MPVYDIPNNKKEGLPDGFIVCRHCKGTGVCKKTCSICYHEANLYPSSEKYRCSICKGYGIISLEAIKNAQIERY